MTTQEAFGDTDNEVEDESSRGAAMWEEADDAELQRIWLAAQALEWRSLALVPASDDVDVIDIAHAFAALGLRNRGEPIGVADLRAVPHPNLREPIEIIRWHIRRGERVILALKSCFGNFATIPLGRAADCAILCLALGSTRISDAHETVDQVGRDRFIGTLLVKASPLASVGRTGLPRLRAHR